MPLLRLALLACLVLPAAAWGQAASDKNRTALESGLQSFEAKLTTLEQSGKSPREVADAAVCAKAVEWAIRHNEFYKPDYEKWALEVLKTGEQRAEDLAAGKHAWRFRPETTVLGYHSQVDESYQPLAVTLPAGYEADETNRYPLHIVLHGRGDQNNEVQFFHQHDGKKPKESPEWIQLDVFGRGNNGYRWAGEADVFEALQAVERLYRVDDRRITLWGFSMGGGGAWHLGLHHPARWSSAGAGAGFADTVNYLNMKTPPTGVQAKLLHIYDAVDYAENAAILPIIGYGGEKDKQLLAGKTMHARAKELGVEIPLLVGPGMEHKWHPDSFKEFMAFHKKHSDEGRPTIPPRKKIRFVTYTAKYGVADWLTVEELIDQYEPARVEAEIDEATSTVNVTASNVAVLQVGRELADVVVINGSRPLELSSAADGLLPGVYYERRGDEWRGDEWRGLNYRQSREFELNTPRHKHRDLQGPVDDAFMQPFVIVKGTGTPWSRPLQDYANWSQARLEREFDKWMRGRPPVVNDTGISDETIEQKHLILFGDPGSNAVLAKVVDELPLKWTSEGIEVNGKKYDPATSAVVLIAPNPMNPTRYVVINSGHSFHEKEFKGSNVQLYPRIADVAVIKFAPEDGHFTEQLEWTEILNHRWQFPEKTAP